MKKLMMLLVVFGFVFGFSQLVMAEPAVVIDEGFCNLYNGDGELVVPGASSFHQVQTNSENGNVILKCSAKKMKNTDGKAARFDYSNKMVPCATGYGLTNNWFNQVSASGNSTLTCILPEKEIL